MTYSNDLLGRSIAGASYLTPALDVAALLTFWAIFLLLGARPHALSKRA